MKEIPYLKEEELEKLIRHIEEEELTAAPVDLLQNLLSAIEAEEGKHPVSTVETEEQKHPISQAEKQKHLISDTEKRRREYRRFCYQVGSSVAAAVLLILAMSVHQQDAAVPSKKFVIMKERTVISKEAATEQVERGVLSSIRHSETLRDILYGREN